MRITGKALAIQGYAVIGNEAVRIEDGVKVEDLAKLSEEELHSIGVLHLKRSETIQEEVCDLGRKAAAHRWWVGRVFKEVKQRKTRGWSEWLSANGLSAKRRTIDDAIQLSEKMSLERASELGLTDAMREAAVWPERPIKPEKTMLSPATQNQDQGDKSPSSKDERANDQPYESDSDDVDSDDCDGEHGDGGGDNDQGAGELGGDGNDHHGESATSIELELSKVQATALVEHLGQLSVNGFADTVLIKLQLTVAQLKVLRKQLEQDLDSYEPATLADVS